MSDARVTPTQVKEIITTDISDTVLYTSMIETATLFVDAHLGSSNLSAEILERIELYLAAHFVAITEESGAMILDKLGDATTEWAADWCGPGFAMVRQPLP
jgi:hypothetical protein